MNYLKNNRGSALLLVLIMSIVFTILGTTLLASALNGSSRNAFREDQIQATYGAKQGVEYFLAHINQNFLAYQGLSPTQYNTALGNFMNEYPYSSTDATIGKRINIDISAGHYAIISVKSISNVTSHPDDLRRRVEVVSKGYADGKKVEVTSQYLVSATTSVLKYTMAAMNDLKIHGALSILGDVFVNRHLVVTPHSYNSLRLWPSSDLPTIEPLPDSTQAKLTVGGKLFRLTQAGRDWVSADPNRWNNHYRTNFDPSAPINSSYVQEISRINHYELFKQGVPLPKLTSSTLVNYTPIDIFSYKSKYAFGATSTQVNGSTVTPLRIYPTYTINSGTINVIDNYQNSLQDSYYLQTLNSNTTYMTNNFSSRRLSVETPGYLYLHSSNTGISVMNFDRGAYIKSPAVVITHHGSTNADGSINTSGRTLRIRGPLYIEGDLYIDLANVEFDSTVYVTGRVIMTSSDIKGFQRIDASGNPYITSLALFSDKEISTANINHFTEVPLTGLPSSKVLRAFLYSNSVIDMYGQSSIIHIDGGVVGKDLNFKVMKGNTKNSQINASYWKAGDTGEWYEGNQTSIPAQRSRFRVTYNKDLIANPPEGMPIDSVKIELTNQQIK